MESAVTIGLDLAKSVFQVHGVDAGGAVVVQRRLTRGKLLAFFAKQPACLVGMEACAAAHHWGRELGKLGHRVRLMPPRYVKPYIKRQKNDAADAEAICEAVRHGTKRPWLVQLLARRTPKIATVALANKMARMIWAMMMTGERYREPIVAGA
jgi:transposase